MSGLPEPTPVPITVTRYRCPFCTRSRAKRAATADHIARCWNNPGARACKTCAHYEPSEPGPYPEHPGWRETCSTGLDLGAGLRTGCPTWEPKEDDDA